MKRILGLAAIAAAVAFARSERGRQLVAQWRRRATGGGGQFFASDAGVVRAGDVPDAPPDTPAETSPG